MSNDPDWEDAGLGEVIFAPVELLAEDFTRSELLLMLAVYSFRDAGTNLYWPGVDEIMARCNLSIDEVGIAFRSLLARHWIDEKGFPMEGVEEPNE